MKALASKKKEELDAHLAIVHSQKGEASPVPRAAGTGHFDWLFTIPYPFCRASSVIQFDGYVRLIEDTIDRFLRAQGISVRRLLVERSWIPVVTSWRISITNPAFMEENLLIRADVTNVFKNLIWDTDLLFVVMRDGEEIEVARSAITHGYAITRGLNSGQMATLDDEVLSALGKGA